MKKLFGFILLGFIISITALTLVQAEEEPQLIELYPYGQKACLDMADACTQLKVGSSFWNFAYNGYRYHVVRGGARYVTEFVDLNSDGFISANEIGALSYNAFGALTINDTDEAVVLSTVTARTDLTTVVHRIYAYFNENKELAMFEDHIHQYYIFNEGTETPDWRLATTAEKDAYIAADPKPADTRYTHIRMALSDVHPRGYVLEPLRYLQWVNADVDTATAPVAEWSTIVEGNPNFVYLPAGWSSFSFSTNDRGGYVQHVALIQSMPNAMINPEVDPMVLTYQQQPPSFLNLGLIDNDPNTPGVNIIVDYLGDFDLENVVTARWLNMFDVEGKIINQTMNLDYEVIISTPTGQHLETITFTYDPILEEYVASGEVTVVDSSSFGAGYVATYSAESSLGQVTEVAVPISVGVLAPRFSGIQNRYITEGTIINVLQGITADDGYGNSKTDDINVTLPAGFNPYAPKPGVYEIGLDFTHNFFIPGSQPNVNMNGTVVPFNVQAALNQPIHISTYAALSAWTDLTNFRDSITGWGSVMVVVGANGTVVEKYDRYDWGYTYFKPGTIDFKGTIKPFDADVALNKPLQINIYHKPAVWTDLTHFRTTTMSWGSVAIVVGADGTMTERYDRYNWNYTSMVKGGVDFNGTIKEFDSVAALNQDIDINVYQKPAIWTDLTHFRDSVTSWGSVVVVVGANGTVTEIYDRYNWNHTTANGTVVGNEVLFNTWKAEVELEQGGFIVAAHGSVHTPALRALAYANPVSYTENAVTTIVGDQTHFDTWKANVQVEPGGFVVGAHGSLETPPLRATNLSYGDPVTILAGAAVTEIKDLDHFTAWKAAVQLQAGGFIIAAHGGTHTPPLRALAYGNPVVLDEGVEEFDYDIITTTTFTITVDDVTPPILMVVDPNYSIIAGQHNSINQAILRNVVAFDLHDNQSQLSIYVSNNGGLSLVTAGVYTVIVTAEDRAGNATTATFNVTVVQPEITADMIQDMIENSALTEQEIIDLIDEILGEQEPIEPEPGCAGVTASTKMNFTSILTNIFFITMPIFFITGIAAFLKSNRGF